MTIDRACRCWRWVGGAALTLAFPAVWAQAQGNGLQVDDSTFLGSRWQARIALNTSTAPGDGGSAAWQSQAGVLMGDYYFSRTRLGLGQARSGFRATSGVLLGQRSLALGTPALAGSAHGVGLTLLRQPRWALGASESAAEPWAAMPYLGVGWSGSSDRGGWGVSADFGFVGRGNGGLRMNGASTTDELLRELRLSPMLQLGVSYAF